MAVFLLSAQGAWARPEELPSWATTRADTTSFALVLGGGGVRGFAHIGVLKVLEEEGLRPSLIVGTSMGAVVGALYACGYSAEELETMVKRERWLELFGYRPPPPASMQGGWGGLPRAQISLLAHGFPPMPPPSLSRGAAIETLLGRLTADPLYAAGNDFDRLPIAFRAIAVDVDTGEMVVLSRGSLASALRASGSVPLFLPPVAWEGHELVDGGFRANNPVEIARRMGFTRSLVVDVSNVFVPGKGTPDNLMEMWVRSMELQQYEGNVVHPGPGELVLHLPLEDYRSLEFDDAGAIIRIGYEQASRLRPRLRALDPGIGKEEGKGKGRGNPPVLRTPPMSMDAAGEASSSGSASVVRLRRLECPEPDGMSRAELLRRLDLHPGDRISPSGIWARVDRLVGTPGVQRAWVEIEPLGGGEFPPDHIEPAADGVFHLRLRHRPRWELAGHVISDDTAAVLGRLRQSRLPLGAGEAALSWRYSGRTTAADLRWRQELPPGGSLSLLIGGGWSRDRPWVYRRGEKLDRWAITDAAGRMQLGWGCRALPLQLRMGVEFRHLESYLESRSTAGSGPRWLGAWVAEVHSGVDRGLVERRREGVSVRYLRGVPGWGDLDLWRLEAGAVGRWDRDGWWQPEGAVGGVWASEDTPVELTGRAGGPLGWIGLRRQEILAPRLGWMRGGVSLRLSSLLRLGAAAAVGWHDDRSLQGSRPLWGGGVALRWLVPGGPIALYWTVAEDRRPSLLVQIGPEF